MVVLVIGWECDASGADLYSSISDSEGNTWTRRVNADGGNDEVVTGVFTTAQDGGVVTTSTTITVSFSGNLVGKSVNIWEVAPTAGGTGVEWVTGAAGEVTLTVSGGITTGTIYINDAVICGNVRLTDSGIATWDTDTTNGSWGTGQTIESGANLANTASQYKVQTTADSTQNWAIAWGGTLTYSGNVWGQFRETGRTFPSVEETDDSGSAATSHTVTLPACDTGDLLIVIAAVASTNTQTYTFDGSTTAFTQLGTASANARVTAKAMVMTSGHTTSMTLGSSNEARRWAVLRIPAGEWSGVLADIATGTATGSGAPNPPSLTPAYGVSDYLWIVTCSTYSDYAPTAPSGFTGYTLPNRIGLGTRQLQAGTFDPAAFSGSSWNGSLTIAVPAAPAGVPASWSGAALAAADPQTVVLPTFATGDLLIVSIYAEGSTVTIGDWTYGGATDAFTALWATGTQGKFQSRYRVMEDGDSGDISVDLSAAKMVSYVVAKVPAGDFDADTVPEAAVGSEGLATTADPPSLNPTGWGTEDTLWLVIAQGKTGATVSAYPEGFTGFRSYVTSQATIAAAWRQTTAASVDPGVVTFSASSYSNAGTIAVRLTGAVEQPSVSITATGGGVLTPSPLRGSMAVLTPTGAGVVGVSIEKGATAGAAPTGGGVATVIGTKAGLTTVALTGGGTVLVASTKAAYSSPSDTGGGVVTTDPEKQAFSAVVATGGGVVVVSTEAFVGTSVAITGGGSVTIDTRGDHTSVVVATGGGIATIDPDHTHGALIIGMTRDGNGNPIPGCTVDLFRVDTNAFVGTTVSNGLGEYTIASPVGVECFAVAYIDVRVGVSARDLTGEQM